MNKNNARVLIADGDAVGGRRLADELRELGYDARLVGDGASALAFCSAQPPDLAVVDTSLPDMSGVELARRLREEATPVMFLSARAERASVVAAIDQGAFAYLVKPQRADAVAASIDTVLARVAEARAQRARESGLSVALKQRRETSVALGILMTRFRIDVREAFELLRGNARAQRRKVSDVAAALVRGLEDVDSLRRDL